MVVSDSSYKRQKLEGRKFLTFSKLTIRDFPALNANANQFDILLISYANNIKAKSKKKISSNYFKALVRLVNTGVKRLFIESRNGGIRCDLEYEDLLNEVKKYLGEGKSYNEIISQDLFPSPFENFNKIEVIETIKGKTDCAFVGHYIRVDMKASELLNAIGKDEFNFNFLGDLLKEFFNGVFFTEDFLNANVMKVAFRLCFLGEAYTNDDSNDNSEEQFIRIKFSNSFGELKAKLIALSDKRKKEEYKDWKKDPLILWILPIFAMYDVNNFERDEGNRLGFYAWYRGNLVDF